MCVISTDTVEHILELLLKYTGRISFEDNGL